MDQNATAFPLWEGGGLSFCGGYGILLVRVLPASSTRCVPLGSCLAFSRGALLAPTLTRKGGLPMVTLSDLIQVGILVVGVIELVLHLIELDRDRRQ